MPVDRQPEDMGFGPGPLSAAKIRLVKTAQRALGLDDVTYRAALEAHGGVSSAKHLTEQGFRDLMAHFERCGFEVRQTFQSPRSHSTRRPGMATEAQIKKIYASWWSLSGAYYKTGQERKALREFLAKRFEASHENFLTFDKAHQAIEAIKAIQGRKIAGREG